MVFHSQIRQGSVPPDKELNTESDEYSIGSTISANPQVHKLEIDAATPFDQQHDKWHVVSTSNKIPKNPKQDCVPPRPMRYSLETSTMHNNNTKDIHQQNLD